MRTWEDCEAVERHSDKVGLLIVVIGLMGEIYVLADRAGIVAVGPSDPASLGNSSLWIACGVALILLARPVGRFLGKGLD